jgi:hypothetical protein
MNYARFLDQLEFDSAIAPLNELERGSVSDASGGPTGGGATARQQATHAFLEVLRHRQPDGRLVLNMAYDAPALPLSLGLEDNDKITIPSRPVTVGIFGAVFQPGSVLFRAGTTIGDYIKLAGGPQRYADRGEVFVIHANGALISTRQKHDLVRAQALPGDLVFVPIRSGPSGFERFRELSTIIYQLGLGAASVGVLGLVASGK